jgi:hypothetical protein
MKKIYYWLIGIVLVLIITNPTFRDFENHLPSKDIRLNENRMKLNNYFIASTYVENSKISTVRSPIIYLGILGNFFVIDRFDIIADPLYVPTHADSDRLRRDTTAEKN